MLECFDKFNLIYLISLCIKISLYLFLKRIDYYTCKQNENKWLFEKYVHFWKLKYEFHIISLWTQFNFYCKPMHYNKMLSFVNCIVVLQPKNYQCIYIYIFSSQNDFGLNKLKVL